MVDVEWNHTLQGGTVHKSQSLPTPGQPAQDNVERIGGVGSVNSERRNQAGRKVARIAIDDQAERRSTGSRLMLNGPLRCGTQLSLKLGNVSIPASVGPLCRRGPPIPPDHQGCFPCIRAPRSPLNIFCNPGM